VPIHKLGHSGFVVDDLDTEIGFYCRHFNFKPSDVVAGAGRDENQVFMHIDLGKTYTEHHAFIIARPFGPLKAGKPHHAAFEVESMDTTFIGHEHLGSKGHKPFWGVGRHIEGSQVFDYWFDPDGFMVEHYADGDLVNENKEVGFVPTVPHHEMNNWGPAVNIGPPKAGANGYSEGHSNGQANDVKNLALVS
jgi:catechol 2,3-dioxygenase-like lactoylglutathione lyase family enzyme